MYGSQTLNIYIDIMDSQIQTKVIRTIDQKWRKLFFFQYILG